MTPAKTSSRERIRAERKAAGLCRDCGAPADGRARCARHAERHSHRQKLRDSGQRTRELKKLLMIADLAILDAERRVQRLRAECARLNVTHDLMVAERPTTATRASA